MNSDSVISRFVEAVAEHPDGVQSLRLFGSRARGDAHADSDYDVLVVVRERTGELRARLYDIVLDILFATGRTVSLKIYPQAYHENMTAKGTPFLSNVQREGVLLYY